MSSDAPKSQEIGKYVLPIMPSIEGIGPDIDRKLGKAFAGVSKQASRALADGVKDGVAEAEAAVKKSSDVITKLRDKEAGAADKLRVAEERINEVRAKGGSALARAEAQRNAAYRVQQSALRDIEQQTRSLERAQQSLADAQEQAARGGERAGSGFLSGLRGAVSGAGSAGSDAAASFAEGFAGSSALLRLGSAGGPIGLALAAAGAIGGGLLVKNVLAGIEREPARDLIQARLGINDAGMARVAASAGKAYVDNFGQSLQDNMSAAQLAIQGGLVMDGNDPALAGVVGKLQAISQLIGSDLAETTKSASILLRSGLAGSAEEAFDIIAKGYRITGDLGGDFLDSIGEYSSGWKNAGLSAKQALALIKQGQDLGVDVTDRSADALREFGRRIAENGDDIVNVLNNIGLDGQAMFAAFKQGGPAGFAAFDAVFDRIRSIEDPVRRNQAAMALLGDTAGDFIGSFTQWDPSQAVADFGSIEGAAQNAADTMGDNVAGSFESARRSIEFSVDRVQDSLTDGFGPTLQNIADWVREHEDDITGFFFDLGDFALLGVKSVVKATADGSRALAQLVNAVGDAYGGITIAIAGVNDLLGRDEIADQLRKDAEAGFGLADGIYAIADQADGAVSEIDTWRDALRDAEGAASDAKDATGGLGDKLGQLPRQTDVVLNVTDGTGRPVPLDGSARGWWATGNSVGGGPLSINTPAGQNPLLDQARQQFGLTPGQALPPIPGMPNIIPGSAGQGFLGVTGPGNGGAEQWRPLVQQALNQFGPLYGVTNYRAWEDALVQQIKTESGGNPASVNPNDTNGRGGTQRVAGILNFLQSTYDANNITGLPYMDPFGQIAAAIPYVAKKWGIGPDGRPNQIGRGQGFEYGGQVFGGVRGRDSVFALLAGDEHVVTTDEVDAAGGHNTWYRLRAMARAGMLRGFESGGAVSPEIQQIAQIAQGFGLQLTSGKRDEAGSFHNTGEAGDFSNGVRTQQELAFATFMAQNYGSSLAELIYDDPRFGMEIDEGKVVPREFFAAAGDHTNHVHIAVRGSGGGLQLGNSSLPGSTSLSVSGPMSPNVTNAFGAGYQPGIGTPGYNEFGEPGYYQTDPRSIAQADRRARDAQRSIADADQAVTDAEARRAEIEIEKDITASAEDRAKADRDIERAREAASRAREDAQWAEADAEEARRGRFTAAREAKQQNQQQGGAGDLSGLGGIFGSFLKETFGVDGSLFPDLSNLMPVKMFGAAMGAFKGPLQGLIDGQLGIQQPGWQPGMPVQQPGSASGLPFGMVPSPFDIAGIAQPGMPVPGMTPGTPASGAGFGPPPGPIDQSRHMSVTVNGYSQQEVVDQTRRQMFNVDRLATNFPIGWGG